jgi:hypothetical protein
MGWFTPGGASRRAGLARGYYQAIPTGFQFGSLRSQDEQYVWPEVLRETVKWARVNWFMAGRKSEGAIGDLRFEISKDGRDEGDQWDKWEVWDEWEVWDGWSMAKAKGRGEQTGERGWFNAEFLVFSFEQPFPPGGVGARVAVHGGANEVVEALALEALPAGLFAESFDLFGVVQFLEAAGAEFGALAPGAAGTVEAVDEGPIKVAAGVEAPVARNNDHGAVRGGIDADLEEERAVVFHAVEFPAVTEGVEEEMETAAGVRPVEGPAAFAEVALLGHAAADNAAGVLEFVDGEEALEFGPFGGESFVLEKGLFLFVEFGGLFEHFFVAAGFDVVFEGGDGGLGLWPRRWVNETQELNDAGCRLLDAG